MSTLQDLWDEINEQCDQLEVRQKELEAQGNDPAALAELEQVERLLFDSYETLDISGYFTRPELDDEFDRIFDIKRYGPPPTQYDAFPLPELSSTPLQIILPD